MSASEEPDEPPTDTGNGTGSGSRRTRLVVVVAALLLLLPALLVAGFVALPYGAAAAVLRPVLAVIDDAPDLPADIDRPAERSVVLAADGSEIATLSGEENRIVVPLEEIPEQVRQAALAIEDAGFREHAGVDHRALVRATWTNIRARGIVPGGSTITQQYIKNAVLTAERTIDRKTTEMRYAIELERQLDKDEILERYLNTAYFGEGVYGIATAAGFYFSKDPQELTLAEGALLAGLLVAPERLNPAVDPDAAAERRDLVLARMAEEGFISPEERDAAAGEAVAVDLSPLPPPDNPFVVEHVKQVLFADESLGATQDERERVVFTGGLEIHTTIDPRMQGAAEAAIAEHLDDPIADPMAALVTVEPPTGAVRALAVGPKEFGVCEDEGPCPRTQVNPAVPGLGGSGRQPGSAFKPVVLAAALAEDVPRGWQEVTDSESPIDGCDEDDGPWRPRNFDPADGGVKDMDEALTVSNNVYHAKLIGLLQPEPVAEMAGELGIVHGSLPETCALSLGAGAVFPIELATAFATIADGQRCAPFVVSRVVQREEVLAEHEPDCEAALDPGVAVTLTDLLRGPIDEGTATAAQIGRPAAGKTGTTDDFHDAWFVGYVPQLATAVWIGHEDPRPLEDVAGVAQVTGGTIPAQIWAAYMAEAVEGLEPANFPAPPAEEPVTVPDGLEGTLEELTASIDGYDLNVEAVEVRDFRPAGTVVEQRPDPGTRVARGTLLAVGVSDGTGEPPEVPSVLGLPEQEAVEILTEAGYEVRVEEERSRVTLAPEDDPADLDPADGTVGAQDPEPGTTALPGETVTIEVVRYDVERAEPDPTPTPRAGADEPSPEQADAPVVISGVRPHRNADQEFVLLTNTTDERIDLGGAYLLTAEDERLDIAAGKVIEPGGELRVYTGSGQDRPDRSYSDREEPVLGEQGELRLVDASGREIHRTRY
jgi:penicillin-binding protein 1A